MSHGEYIFLTNDSGVGNSHAEPNIPCYHVEKLNRLIYRKILATITGTSVEPTKEEIIRTVGTPKNGVCIEKKDDTSPTKP